MQLEEMRMARKMGETDPDLAGKPGAGKEKVRRPAGCGGPGLRAQWQVWDAGDAAARKPRKRRWWPCSTGGATSAIWFAT
jgi:hypothetical protein